MMNASETEVLKAFAAALRVLRQRRGLSQEKLSMEGVSRGHLSDLERGVRDPRLTMLWKLCELLDVEFSALAREIERRVKKPKAGE